MTPQDREVATVFHKLIQARSGLPPAFDVRVFAAGMWSSVHLLNRNASMLTDVTDPNRFNSFLVNVLNYVPAGITIAHEDALRLLVTLCVSRKEDDEKALSTVSGAGNLADPAFDYPSHVASDMQRNDYSAGHIWKIWTKTTGKPVSLSMRMRPAHITDRRRSYRNGGTVKAFVDFHKDLNDAQREDGDVDLATSGGASLTFRAPSKGDDVKRLGKLNTVVGRFAYNEAVAGNFTNPELARMSGARGLEHGVRYYLSETITYELVLKYNRFIAMTGVTLAVAISCLNRFERTFQDCRAMQPEANPNDLWIECVNSSEVWKHQVDLNEEASDDNAQACFDHFFGGGCSRKECKFRHTGAAPRRNKFGGRGGRGGGWGGGGGGWGGGGSYVPIDADGRVLSADGAQQGGAVQGAGGVQGAANAQQRYQWVASPQGKGYAGKGKGKGGGKGKGRW